MFRTSHSILRGTKTGKARLIPFFCIRFDLTLDPLSLLVIVSFKQRSSSAVTRQANDGQTILRLLHIRVPIVIQTASSFITRQIHVNQLIRCICVHVWMLVMRGRAVFNPRCLPDRFSNPFTPKMLSNVTRRGGGLYRDLRLLPLCATSSV